MKPHIGNQVVQLLASLRRAKLFDLFFQRGKSPHASFFLFLPQVFLSGDRYVFKYLWCFSAEIVTLKIQLLVISNKPEGTKCKRYAPHLGVMNQFIVSWLVDE